ncbi:MAG: signal peptidase I [Propionibacteriaceae bacterium]|jgi:signal peptidase|nr:signal peptidase I [Propionibacteriaceae bacterium]
MSQIVETSSNDRMRSTTAPVAGPVKASHLRKRGWRERLQGVMSVVTAVAMVVLVGCVILFVLIPKLTGGMSLTVLTGSMRPLIQPGDVVLTTGVDAEEAERLAVGDIITFLPYPNDPTLVTHRIIAKSLTSTGEAAYTTKGDDNNAEDPWGSVTAQQIRGEVVLVVPKVGYLRQWAGDNTRWILMVASGLLIGYGVITFVASFRKPRTISGASPASSGEGDPLESIGAVGGFVPAAASPNGSAGQVRSTAEVVGEPSETARLETVDTEAGENAAERPESAGSPWCVPSSPSTPPSPAMSGAPEAPLSMGDHPSVPQASAGADGLDEPGASAVGDASPTATPAASPSPFAPSPLGASIPGRGWPSAQFAAISPDQGTHR